VFDTCKPGDIEADDGAHGGTVGRQQTPAANRRSTMLRVTMIAASAALAIATASTAFALEGYDGDNNPVPSGRAVLQGAVLPNPGANVFAGPRFTVRRPATHRNPMGMW
jgi:hypothetical protein